MVWSSKARRGVIDVLLTYRQRKFQVSFNTFLIEEENYFSDIEQSNIPIPDLTDREALQTICDLLMRQLCEIFTFVSNAYLYIG